MKMKKLKIDDAATDQMGYFSLLPDELTLSILSKINDLKTLCQNLLVSKNFASMIYRVQDISVNLPTVDIDCKSESCMPDSLPALLRKLRFCEILHKFNELKSVYVEFTCPIRSTNCSRLLKWKAVLGNPSAIITNIICLLADTIVESTRGESADEKLDYDEILLEFCMSWNGKCLIFPFACCQEWIILLIWLIQKCRDTLQSVTITDSHKHGIFEMRNEQLVEWKKSFTGKKISAALLKCPKLSATGVVPRLYLPRSRKLMERVILVKLDFEETSGNDDNPMNWEYNKNENVLCEAVREFLMKHKCSMVFHHRT